MERPTLTVGAFDAVSLGAISAVIIISVGLGVMLGMTLGCSRGAHRTRRGRPAQTIGGASVVLPATVPPVPAPELPAVRRQLAVAPTPLRPGVQWERGWSPADRGVVAAGRVDAGDDPAATVRVLRTEHDRPHPYAADHTYRVAVRVAGGPR